jgi:DNA-directed RNA polymerase specialized sigma24 family protein
MLGSLSEAEDAVQEAWLRLSRSDTRDIENLGGWLTTVVGRVCLDMLRARTARREDPLEAHLPDPIVSHADGSDPEAVVMITVPCAVAPSIRKIRTVMVMRKPSQEPPATASHGYGAPGPQKS